MKNLTKSCAVTDVSTQSVTDLTGVSVPTQTVSEKQLKEEAIELRIDQAIEDRYHNHRG